MRDRRLDLVPTVQTFRLIGLEPKTPRERPGRYRSKATVGLITKMKFQLNYVPVLESGCGRLSKESGRHGASRSTTLLDPSYCCWLFVVGAAALALALDVPALLVFRNSNPLCQEVASNCP